MRFARKYDIPLSRFFQSWCRTHLSPLPNKKPSPGQHYCFHIRVFCALYRHWVSSPVPSKPKAVRCPRYRYERCAGKVGKKSAYLELQRRAQNQGTHCLHPPTVPDWRSSAYNLFGRLPVMPSPGCRCGFSNGLTDFGLWEFFSDNVFIFTPDSLLSDRLVRVYTRREDHD